MTNDEQEIKKITSRNNPLKVPGGYFDQLTDNIMSQIPDTPAHKQQPATPVINLWDKIKPWLYMTAMFIGITITFQNIKKIKPQPTSENYTATEQLQPPEEITIEQLADEAMIDPYTLYQYITEE